MSAQLKQAITQPSAGPTDIFGVAYLQLCQISYAIPSAIPQLVASAVTPFSPGGSWSCVWGPATDYFDANLAYVASYADSPGTPPVCAIAVIRGTDTDTGDLLGVLEQAFEDFTVAFQSTPPWLPASSPALVADGTLTGLETIQSLTDANGVGLLDFLGGYLSAPANQNPVLVVTGHSLGGCLTTVTAPWLGASLGQYGAKSPIVPATFAAPTAGNKAFADYYTSTFGYCPRYYNTLDVAPLAWSSLSAVLDVLYNCVGDVPDAVGVLLEMWNAAMWVTGASYAQQSSMNAPLKGSCDPNNPTKDWFVEADYQHHTTTYMALLGGQSVVLPPSLLAQARPRRRRLVRHRLRLRFQDRAKLLPQKG